MDILRNYFETEHILYCDNYYSSPQLFMDLWVLGTGATVTEKLKISLNNRGDTSSAHYDPLSCLKYQYAKNVYILSTTQSSHDIETNRHDFHQNQAKIKPSMVYIYDHQKESCR